MAVEVGNGSRVVISVRGAGLKGDPGSTPTTYLRSIAEVDDSDRIVVRDANGSAFYLGNVTAQDVGDGVVMLTITNRNGSVVRAAITGGDDIVVLQSPTIYLREDGQANPPIASQDDLTEANAFNSMAAIRAFMRKTLTKGGLTINVAGTFTAQGDVSPTSMNVNSVTVRGATTDPEVATFQSDGNSSGIVVGSGSVVIRDVTLRIADGDTVAGRVGGLAAAGGRANLRGSIRFTGNYDKTKPNRDGVSHLAYASQGSGDIDLTDCRLIFDMNSGHDLDSGFASYVGARFRIGAGQEYVFNSDVRVTQFFHIAQSSYAVGYVSPDPVPVFSGSGSIIATHLWGIRNGASLVFNGWNPLTHAAWPVASIVNSIAPYAIVGGQMGLDL